jgi:hypothetical protein
MVTKESTLNAFLFLKKLCVDEQGIAYIKYVPRIE